MYKGEECGQKTGSERTQRSKKKLFVIDLEFLKDQEGERRFMLGSEDKKYRKKVCISFKPKKINK